LSRRLYEELLIVWREEADSRGLEKRMIAELTAAYGKRSFTNPAG
jgi:hypothetical protein